MTTASAENEVSGGDAVAADVGVSVALLVGVTVSELVEQAVRAKITIVAAIDLCILIYSNYSSVPSGTKNGPEKISEPFYLVLVRYELEVCCLAYAIQVHSTPIGMDFF
jgi:hypothetical protein